MLQTTKEQRAIWHKAGDSDTQALVSDLEETLHERDLLTEGKCIEFITDTFVACGEIGHYCSLACRLRATSPKPCLPDENLQNVEEVAIEAGKTKDVYISNEAIADMAREIREWRAWSKK